MPHRNTILVVDDDAAILALVRECLGDEGYRVVAASTEADALTALSAVRFALVLTDAFVGRAAGALEYWAALERIRAAAGATPVVIFSAHAEPKFAGFAGRGFHAVVHKPFDLDDLAAAVRQAVELHGRTAPGWVPESPMPKDNASAAFEIRSLVRTRMGGPCRPARQKDG
jgi:CheY-like chemotaxis protein